MPTDEDLQFSDEERGELSSSGRRCGRRLVATHQNGESLEAQSEKGSGVGSRRRASRGTKQSRGKSSLELQHDEEDGLFTPTRTKRTADEDDPLTKKSLKMCPDEELKIAEDGYPYYSPTTTGSLKPKPSSKDLIEQTHPPYSFPVIGGRNVSHLHLQDSDQRQEGSSTNFRGLVNSTTLQHDQLRPGAVRVAGINHQDTLAEERTLSVTTPPQQPHQEAAATQRTTIHAIPVNEDELENEFERRILARSVPAQVVSLVKSRPLWASKKMITFGAITTIAVVGLIVGVSVGLASMSPVSSEQQESDPCQGSHLDVLQQCECFGEIQEAAVESILQVSYKTMRQSLQGEVNTTETSTVGNSIFYSCSAENLALWWLANDTMDEMTPQEQNFNGGLLSQRYTLATLYLATRGQDWNRQGQWLTRESECSWNGVGCNTQGAVTQIVLPKRNLNGTVPDGLSHLTSLLDITLNDNMLRGTFPDLADLTVLENIDLSHNEFEGSLPRLFDLNDLAQATLVVLESGSNISLLDIYLDSSLIGFGRRHANVKLSHNRFSGEMPPDHWIGSTLREYRIDNNQITGTFELDFLSILPVDFLPHIVNFTVADFDSINRSPSSIVHEVEVLDISNNQFTGTFPGHLHLLTDFEYCNISFNQFSSTIPSALEKWEEVVSIDLSYNMLRGTIPKELAELPQLRFLYLSGNFLSGTFPNEICSSSPSLFPPRINCTAVTGCTCCRCD